MRRRVSAVLVGGVALVVLAGGCGGQGSSGRTAVNETTSTDALDGARAQLDDVNGQLSQVADDSKAAQAGLDDNEGDTNP